MFRFKIVVGRFPMLYMALVISLLATHTYAQMERDTVALNLVTIRGFVPQNFMAGLKYQTVDSVLIQQFRFQGITDLLGMQSSLFFKNYGSGQLTTASFRGTSANHTAVLWNGLNVNSASLGQTDFSTIPVAGFDKLSVQYGSASSVVGTDAVGGSILLESSGNVGTNEVSIGRRQESFGNNQAQVFGKYVFNLKNSWTLSGKTALYDNRMWNRFPYSERGNYPILDSETFQKGIVQDVYLKLKTKQEIAAHIWLTNNKLTLTPENVAGRELTRTAAYRTMLRYTIGDLSFRSAWVRDIIDYAKGDYVDLDHAVIDRFANRAEYDFRKNMGRTGAFIQVHAGGETTYYRASLMGYGKPVVTENRTDIFVLTRWQIAGNWAIALNMRQAFITKYKPPLTPSAGIDFKILSLKDYTLNLKATIGKSYRAPNLNERFWKQLGNPDLRPEFGWNKEIGLDDKWKLTAKQVLSTGLTVYHNRIDNWTYWNPSKGYQVENLQQVLSRGIETQIGWDMRMAKWSVGIQVNYSMNKSTQEKAYDSYSKDILGKQLRFVPRHSGNVYGYFQFQKTRLTAQLLGTGRRFTTVDNSRYLKAYQLINLTARHDFIWNKVSLGAQLQANNVGNTLYLSSRGNAMPGHNYSASLFFSYKGKAPTPY